MYIYVCMYEDEESQETDEKRSKNDDKKKVGMPCVHEYMYVYTKDMYMYIQRTCICIYKGHVYVYTKDMYIYIYI